MHRHSTRMEQDLVTLKALVKQLVQLRRQSAASDDVIPVIQKAAVILLKLKGASRETVLKVEGRKDETKEARKRLDQTYLQLQNLLFERNYFRGEVKAAEDFRYLCQSAYCLL